MYIPAHFEESDRDRLHALIAEHPLGMADAMLERTAERSDDAP